MDSDDWSMGTLSMDDNNDREELNSDLSMSSSGDGLNEEVIVMVTLVRLVCDEMDINLRMPQHNIGLCGHQYVYEILNGHPRNCQDLFQLEVDTFCALYSLRGNHFLVDFRREVSVEEAIAMFCVLVGHAQGQRIVEDRFQHSSKIINLNVRAVINAQCELGRDIIRPTHIGGVHPYIVGNP